MLFIRVAPQIIIVYLNIKITLDVVKYSLVTITDNTNIWKEILKWYQNYAI